MIIPISTINYNGAKDTIDLIDSILRTKEEFDLIIVDNNSPNKNELKIISNHIENNFSFQITKLMYNSTNTCKEVLVYNLGSNKFISLIQAKDNYGFAKGTNIGIQFALSRYPSTEYVAILNNDTIVTDGFLINIIRKIESHNLVAAMGTILYYGYEKPYIWSIGGPIDYIKAQGVHLHKDEEFNPLKVNKELVYREFISGCFTVFKTDAISEINFLDEDYFFAGEEYQYSVDLTKIGKIAWIPSSIIYHKSVKGIGNGSSHKISDLKWQYNAYMVKIIFINKNKGILYRCFWRALFRAYLGYKLKRKYLSIPEYGPKGYKFLVSYLLNNLHAKKFELKDFQSFDIDWRNNRN